MMNTNVYWTILNFYWPKIYYKISIVHVCVTGILQCTESYEHLYWKYKIKPRYSELYCEVLLVKITSLLVLSFSVLIFLTYGLLLLFCVTKEDQQWAYILDVNNVHETNEAIIFTIVFMYIRPK